MPFVKFSAKEEIAKQCEQSSSFKNIHEKNIEEYRLIGEMIRARKQSGLTQEEFAQKIGCKQQTISRIEKRENSPSLNTVCNMLGAMGLKLQIVKMD